MRKTLIVGAIVGAIVGIGSASAGVDRTVYVPKDGDGPTVVIRGAFATAEDMTTLRLVEYDPDHGRVVYRVVVP